MVVGGGSSEPTTALGGILKKHDRVTEQEHRGLLTLDLFIARVQESGSLENRKRPAHKTGVKQALHIVSVDLWKGGGGWGDQSDGEGPANGVHVRARNARWKADG